MRADLIVAAQGADGGRALLRTLASAGMQADAEFGVTVALTGGVPESVFFAAPGAKRLHAEGGALEAWRAGAEASDADLLMLLREGDALFDAYSLWRLQNALRETPEAALACGAARCYAPSGAEEPGAGCRAVPQGLLARRDVLPAALARAKTLPQLAAGIFAAGQAAEIPDCTCECGLPDGWFEALCGAADGLSGARAAEWAEKQLAALYLGYVRAGLSGPEAMQAARGRCVAFFRAAWLPLEGEMQPDLLFASYNAAMDAAARIDPNAESGYEPYPMFADILRMECD